MRPVYCPNELFLVAFVGITEPQVAGEQCVWYNACQHPFTETIKVWGVLYEGANYQLSTTGPNYSWIAYRRSFNRSALAVARKAPQPPAGGSYGANTGFPSSLRSGELSGDEGRGVRSVMIAPLARASPLWPRRPVRNAAGLQDQQHIEGEHDGSRCRCCCHSAKSSRTRTHNVAAPQWHFNRQRQRAVRRTQQA